LLGCEARAPERPLKSVASEASYEVEFERPVDLLDAEEPRPPAQELSVEATLEETAVAGERSLPTESPPSAEGPWLADVTVESRVDFVHTTGGSGGFYLPETVGGGLAAFDADGDGRLDLYFTNQNSRLPDRSPSAIETNRFYRQVGSGTFEDATGASGLGDGSYGFGVAVGDVDGDGDPDVFVTNLGDDRLYLNDGGGVFSNAEGSGVEEDGFSTGAVFFDFDRDGDLDLYVVRYVEWQPLDLCTPNSAGKTDYCGPLGFPAATDRLFENDGSGRFEEVSRAAGIADVAAAGLGVVSCDFDEDGWQDLFVANDQYPNHLWRNRGDGTFEEVAVLAGVAVNRAGELEAGMGVVAADLTEDGADDLLLTHLGMQTHTLYERLSGDLHFEDATDVVGIGRPSWDYTGFGVAEFDLELDGDLDLAVANGRVSLERPYRRSLLPEPWNEMAEPNQLFIWNGAGFELALADGGPFSAPVEISRGVVAADLDGDGDDDLVVANLEGSPRILRNDAPREGDWVEVRLSDPGGLGRSPGARIGLEIDGQTVWRNLSASTSYLSSRPLVARFAVPRGETFDRLRVVWPSGERESFAGGLGNTRYLLVRGEGASTVE